MDERRVRVAIDLLALARRYDAGLAWEQAMADAVSHILLVVGNNPGKTMREIMNRPDVRQAISDPFAHAGAETLQAVREAWFQQAGDIDLPLEDLERTLATVRSNTVAAPVRIKWAVMHGDREDLAQRLKVLSGQLTRRAEMSVEYADSRAYTLRVLHEASSSASMKTWRSQNWPGRCQYCKDLDGMTIPIDELFPVGRGLQTYGALIGPPRHPHCRCWLEIT